MPDGPVRMKTIALSLMLLASISVSAADRKDEPRLKEIDATYFTFHIPVYMVKTRSQGIDSHVGGYKSARIRLGFDYGVYSDPLDYDSGLPQYQASTIEVDGRKARIVSFQKADEWFTAIHFPSAAETPEGTIKLTMHASCASQQEVRLARDIFTSVRFKEP